MKIIPLTRGMHTVVDDADYEMLSGYTWHAQKSDNNWYARTSVQTKDGQKNIVMQRLLINPPMEMVVDHKDGDSLNNRRSNLRLASRRQNNWNLKKTTKRKTQSKHKCVQFDRRKNRYYASIQLNGKRYHLASCENEDDAALYYNVAAQICYGEFARLNSI